MSATLYGQGTGRFTAEEISKFKKEVWENVNALLTDSSQKRGSGGLFFVLGGEGPTEADTTLFGFVASGLVCDAYVALSLSKLGVALRLFGSLDGCAK